MERERADEQNFISNVLERLDVNNEEAIAVAWYELERDTNRRYDDIETNIRAKLTASGKNEKEIDITIKRVTAKVREYKDDLN